MKPTRPGNSSEEIFNLRKAAKKLNVTTQELLSWNKLNILKPTITSKTKN